MLNDSFFRPYMYFTLAFCMHLGKLNTHIKSSYNLVTLASVIMNPFD
jgi:hypothetical protein